MGVRLAPVIELAKSFKIRLSLNPLAVWKFKDIPGKTGSSPGAGLAEPVSLCPHWKATDHAGREVP